MLPGGRAALMDALPDAAGRYAFVSMARGIPRLAPATRTSPAPGFFSHWPTCPGIDRGHRAFASDLYAGRLPTTVPPLTRLAPRDDADDEADDLDDEDEAAA